MVRYLDSQNISGQISTLVKEAKDDLYIISPYLKVNSQLIDLIKGKAKNSNNLTIKIIYGKTELKEKELTWIRECKDIRLYYKENLHAKCYLNEENVIITSMNLYEFSQVNNIEMGLLLSRDKDTEAYSKLKEDVRHILENSIRIDNLDNLDKNIEEEIVTTEQKEEFKQSLNRQDSVLFSILKNWRLDKSKEIKQPAYVVFKDNELQEIIKNKPKTLTELKNIQGIANKKINSFGGEILEILDDLDKYSLVEILDIKYEYDSLNGYDRVKVKYLDNNKSEWLDTTKTLPRKGSIVGVKINRTWFNNYFEIE